MRYHLLTHTKQSEAPITAFQLAEAQALLDTADYFGRRLARTVDDHIASDMPWDPATRVRCRFDAARVVAVCRQVCDIVDKASGATAHQHGTRLITILDDIRALTVHSFLLASSAERTVRTYPGRAGTELSHLLTALVRKARSP
ncbi:hypothetical protein [Nocardia cyriacigeorgica]|uniref:hypothetical protein n=1 Tax=Nocardia cyriacigeorgica TaxID=135487 RepID=UPI0015E3A078